MRRALETLVERILWCISLVMILADSILTMRAFLRWGPGGEINLIIYYLYEKLGLLAIPLYQIIAFLTVVVLTENLVSERKDYLMPLGLVIAWSFILILHLYNCLML